MKSRRVEVVAQRADHRRAQAGRLRGPAGARSGRRSAAGRAPPRTARRPRTGWAAGAATWRRSATRRRAPTARRVASEITRPCTNRWSPRSTSVLNAARRSSPTASRLNIACSRLPSPSCSVAKQSLPPIADEDHAAGDADLVVRLGAGLEVRVRGADLRDGVGARDADRVGLLAGRPAAVRASPAGRGSARGRRRLVAGRVASPGDPTGAAWACSPRPASRRSAARRSSARSRIGDECVRPPTDR